MFMRGKSNNELEITFEGRHALEEPGEPQKLEEAMIETAAEAPAPLAGTFIAADAIFEGTIRSNGLIRIAGIVTGTVCSASVFLEEGGQVEGAVVADLVRIAGEMKGSVEAQEIEVLRSAQIHADLTYAEIAIERGARVRGIYRHREEAPQAPEAVAAVTDAAPVALATERAAFADEATQTDEEAALVIGLDELKSRISRLAPGLVEPEPVEG